MKSSCLITIACNGNPMEIPEGTGVGYVIASMNRQDVPCAVFINREFLSKQEYGSTTLQDGDELNIIFFMGGG